MTMVSKTILRAALLITASVGVSGCVYDLGLGYASDGYYDHGYACDAYGGYDAYHDCDYGQGFANIGFGGGWYDNFYYPGYGFFLFDQVGRRYPMRDHHRRYWGEKRQFHFREHRSRDSDGRRYDRRQRGYTNDATPGVIRSPERSDSRVRDAYGPAGRGDGRRGDGQGQSRWRSNDENPNAVPVPQQGQPGVRKGGRGERTRGNGEGRGYRQLPAQPSSGRAEAPEYRPVPQPAPRLGANK